MFGIDDALIWGPILGAAVGGATSKKPLQGALMGAGLGATGAAVAPGLLGAAPAATSATSAAAANPGIAGLTTGGIAGGATDVGLADLTGSGAVLNGIKTPGLLDKTMEYVKPLGQAASSAAQVNSMFNQPEQQIQSSPVMQSQPNNQLGQLVQSIGAEQQAQQQVEQQKRQARKQMIRGLL